MQSASDECGWAPLEIQRGVTPQEYRIAQLTGAGLTGREMAKVLMVGEPTIKTYRSHLYSKLGIPNDVALAVMFVRGELYIALPIPGNPSCRLMASDEILAPRAERAAADRKADIQRKKTEAAERARFKQVRRTTVAYKFDLGIAEKERVRTLLGEKADPTYYDRRATTRVSSTLAGA